MYNKTIIFIALVVSLVVPAHGQYYKEITGVVLFGNELRIETTNGGREKDGIWICFPVKEGERQGLQEGVIVPISTFMKHDNPQMNFEVYRRGRYIVLRLAMKIPGNKVPPVNASFKFLSGGEECPLAE